MATKRGRQMVEINGGAFARIQWDHWSPHGWYNESDFERTAKSFENPDWPEIIWHSYSVRWHEAAKDPRYADINRLVGAARSISVPTLMIQGGSDAATLPASTKGRDTYSTRGYARHVIPGVGHFAIREAPEVVNKIMMEFLRA
jgi:pimeloyl-ACP methyl ester carboxylesterase